MSERPDTAGLLKAVRDVIRLYVVLPDEHFYGVIALWILHAHAIAGADTTPRLIAKSPEKESGKTRLLEVLEMLVSEPINTINATVPAIYRRLEEKQATVLFDEVDAIFSAKAAKDHEDTRALINAGYRRGATVLRMVGVGTKMHSKEFPVFAAMALASIGDLPDTIESRGIIVPMRRRAPGEQVKQFRRRWAMADTGNLRDSLAEWASVYVAELTDAEPLMPEAITDRAADIWEPLLAIADLAGGDWPQRARAAACEIVAGRLAEDQSLGVRLLADIRTAFDGHDRMSSITVLEKLNTLDESGWGGWHDGKGITSRDLARKLKPYGIAPKTLRMTDDSTAKGYQLTDFLDAFSRYLRDGSSVTSVTKGNKDSYSNAPDVTDVTPVTYIETSVSQLPLAVFSPAAVTSVTSVTTSSKPVTDSDGWDDAEHLNGAADPIHDDAARQLAEELAE